jgi:tetratricopeptide (TPR) repeat protein
MPGELLLVVGLTYAVVFQALALLRREGSSIQFVLEAMALTVLAAALAFLGLAQISPIVLVILLYLVTMRARLLVDLANLVARSHRFELAQRIFELGRQLRPDPLGQTVIAANQGAILVWMERFPEAIEMLEGALEDAASRPKFEAAIHYNLGVAYREQGEMPTAIKHLHEVIDDLPNSIYAQRAQALLRRGPVEKATGQEPEDRANPQA